MKLFLFDTSVSVCYTKE